MQTPKTSFNYTETYFVKSKKHMNYNFSHSGQILFTKELKLINITIIYLLLTNITK